MNSNAPIVQETVVSNWRVVSYDIWDTVIRRRCHPDAVKLHMAREALIALGPRIKPQFADPWALFRFRRTVEHQLGKESLAAGADCEYALSEVLLRMVTAAVTEVTTCNDEFIQRLVDEEVAQEKRVAFVDPDICDRMAKDGADRRIFVSDFYMPKDAIIGLLHHLGIADRFDEGYVSCDVGLNKHSGRLFTHVLRSEGCQPHEMMHCGDNPHSDVTSPTALGIQAVLYAPAKSVALRQSNESRFITRSLAAAAPGTDSATDEIDRLALATAPLFIGFALLVLFRARQQKLPNLFFFSREGEFFLRLYRILRQASPYYDELPEGRLLAVSRLATFGPSLADLEVQELMRMWRLYWTQTPRGFLSSLDVCTEENLARFTAAGFPASSRVPQPWLNSKFMSVISDPAFQKPTLDKFAARREDLRAYCRQEGLNDSLAKCGIVDIGWRGTIQDNLALLFPGTQFSGFYLGLNQLVNPQPVNVRKEAFGPRVLPNTAPEVRRLVDFVAPIEMLTNSAGGSVVGYERVGETICPKRSDELNENRVFESFTREFQDSMARVAQTWAPQLNHDAVGPGELREAAIASWRGLISNPCPSMARAYLSLSHNETFGLGEFVDKSVRLEPAWPLRLLLSSRYRKDFPLKLGLIGWIEAYAALHRSPLLLWVARRYFRY